MWWPRARAGIGDVDGDSLDEIAVPFTREDRDALVLVRADGTIGWVQDDLRLHHTYFGPR